MRSRLPLALALVALFVAVGGPAAAADAAKLITGKQIKDGTLTARDFKAGVLKPGPQGPRGEAGAVGATGPQGPQGPAGTAPAAEAWHEVGQPGKPTFINDPGITWSNFDSAHNSAGYYKDPFGIVHLKGVIKCTGAECASAQEIFLLPTGYRPARREVQLGISHNGSATVPARISINSSGFVWRSSELGGTSWLSLDGISFRAL